MKTIFIILFMLMNSSQTKNELAIFGGGCFWCTEATFRAIDGVVQVLPGYSGGELKNPSYSDVCSGETGHAEVISIEFDPNKVTFEQLLTVFFATHDPTTLNRQGADVGTQYRSVIFYTSEEQKNTAHRIIERLNASSQFKKPIITEITALNIFYAAENYHKNYFEKNPNQPYCKIVIEPKIEKFKGNFEFLLKK